ncbi:uncharacterized protein isoform X2 [Leptinotarsa decemlineata]|uniref:uncharacterized protein isoform X2 n=1 Tax=Leptinotarsa decemlineata TaxID=7539 RepID=UPI003D308198
MDRWLHKSDSKKYNDLDQIQTITSQEDPDGDGNRQEMNTKNKNTSSASSSYDSDSEQSSTQRPTRKVLKRTRKDTFTSSKLRKYKFCTNWLELPEMKTWLSKSKSSADPNGHEMAFCKVCKCDILAHKSILKKHAFSEKHKTNLKQVSNNTKLTDIFKNNSLETNIRNAEIKLCGLLTTNNLPFLLMDILSPLLTNIFPDSQIARHLSIKRTKATVVVYECGNIFLNNLYKKLQEPGCFFSLILDETTDISAIKQCAYSVIYFDEEKYRIVNRFFDITEMEGSTADDIFTSLILTLQSKNIPFSNLVGFASDTPNVMVGQYHSVFSLMKDENPNIVCVKCSCHMVHLAASKACLKLPRSVEDLLRNLGSHFNRSSARHQKFKEFQIFFRTEIHKILSPAVTRWLSLKACVDRVLEQYEPLKAYLRETVFEDPSITTENMLTTMDNEFTKLYLEFMSYSLDLLTSFNLLFQSEKPLLHKVKPETEKLLKTLCSNYMEISSFKKQNIFTMNHRNSRNFVPLNNIYLGIQASQSLETMKQNPDVKEKDLEKCLTTILEFYIELVSNIKERFRFDDLIYDILTAQSFSTKSLKHVLDRFPFLTHLCPTGRKRPSP